MEKVYVTQQELKDIVKNNIDCIVTQDRLPLHVDTRLWEDWVYIESENKIYIVDQYQFDFSKYNYLEDMTGFIEDLKYMYENHNGPNDYSFRAVARIFNQIFEKGVVQAEEVKNQLGEIFSSFYPVWIESYGLMINKNCVPADFFEAVNAGLYVKDILPFVQKVVKEKVNRPEFVLDKEKLEKLASTVEFDIAKHWLMPYVNSLKTESDTYVVGKTELILLMAHISLAMSLEFKTGDNSIVFENLLKEYRRIFEINGRNPADYSEFVSKLSCNMVNYNRMTSHEVATVDNTKFKITQGWYDIGYILGSPNNCKLF